MAGVAGWYQTHRTAQNLTCTVHKGVLPSPRVRLLHSYLNWSRRRRDWAYVPAAKTVAASTIMGKITSSMPVAGTWLGVLEGTGVDVGLFVFGVACGWDAATGAGCGSGCFCSCGCSAGCCTAGWFTVAIWSERPRAHRTPKITAASNKTPIIKNNSNERTVLFCVGSM
jgi:hypothetical protein